MSKACRRERWVSGVNMAVWQESCSPRVRGREIKQYFVEHQEQPHPTGFPGPWQAVRTGLIASNQVCYLLYK